MPNIQALWKYSSSTIVRIYWDLKYILWICFMCIYKTLVSFKSLMVLFSTYIPLKSLEYWCGIPMSNTIGAFYCYMPKFTNFHSVCSKYRPHCISRNVSDVSINMTNTAEDLRLFPSCCLVNAWCKFSFWM